jgi:hypothetical protein
MASEFEKILKKEKAIGVSSPRIHALLFIVFVASGVVLMVAGFLSAAGVKVLAVSGLCFAMAALAAASHMRAEQSKLNVELVKAIEELQTKFGKGN